jgi:hypothetical protein
VINEAAKPLDDFCRNSTDVTEANVEDAADLDSSDWASGQKQQVD